MANLLCPTKHSVTKKRRKIHNIYTIQSFLSWVLVLSCIQPRDVFPSRVCSQSARYKEWLYWRGCSVLPWVVCRGVAVVMLTVFRLAGWVSVVRSLDWSAGREGAWLGRGVVLGGTVGRPPHWMTRQNLSETEQLQPLGGVAVAISHHVITQSNKMALLDQWREK